jgi:hypothetical protein
MSDYLVCVDASGGNKQDVYDEIASIINNGGNGKASATAEGVVIRGGGTVELDKKAEQQFSNVISSKFFGHAMDICRQVLADIAPSTPPVAPRCAAHPSTGNCYLQSLRWRI